MSVTDGIDADWKGAASEAESAAVAASQLAEQQMLHPG
jgi:hypothetical protein